MKIVTFNIWDAPLGVSVKRKERISRLGEYLKEHDPDVICLQEAFDTKHRDQIHTALGKETYYTSDKDDFMRKVLLFSHMDMTGGLVTFSKYPIKRAEFTPYKNPILSSIQERIGRKGFLETEIETPNGPLLVISTHLYSLRSSHADGIRIYQLKQIFKKTKEKREAKTTVLAGDLNEDAFKQPKRFKKTLETENFIDSTALTKKEIEPSYRPENPLTQTRFNNGPHPMRLDYILISNLKNLGLQATSNDVLKQPPNPLSDHDPVMVTLE